MIPSQTWKYIELTTWCAARAYPFELTLWGVWRHVISGITIASEADLCTWSVRNEVDVKNLKIGWHACLDHIPYLAMSVQHQQNSYHSLNSSLHCKMVAPYPPYATRYGRKEYGAIRYPSEVATGTVRTWLRSHRPGYRHRIYGTVSTRCTGYGAQPYLIRLHFRSSSELISSVIPPLPLKQLPQVDIAVSSHNH